jgi:hypothetical protein
MGVECGTQRRVSGGLFFNQCTSARVGPLVVWVFQKAANRHLPFIIQNTVVDIEFSKECPYVCICPIQDRMHPHE